MDIRTSLKSTAGLNRKSRTGAATPAARADPNPFSVDGFAAELSRLAYVRADIARSELLRIGATRVRVLSSSPSWVGRGQMMGLACIHRGRGWIALRGTDEPDDWTLNVLFVPFYHPGFRMAWGMLRDETCACAKELADEAGSLVVTGHSLGGAMACLAAGEFARKGLPIEALVTFGAPRVGSPLFARRWNALPARTGQTLGEVTRRYETCGEAVCHVPPFIFGFRHVGRPGSFPGPGTARLHDGALPRRIRAAGAETFGIVAIPLLLLKLLLFAADREPYHRMELYLKLFGIDQPIFNLSARDTDSDYSLGSMSPASWIVLGGVVAGSLGLVLWAMWWSLGVTGMNPFLAIVYLGIFLWAVPDTGAP